MSKATKYIEDEFNGILKDTREYRAYELGISMGYYQLYLHIKECEGVEFAKEVFKYTIDGDDRYCEHFRKMISLDE